VEISFIFFFALLVALSFKFFHSELFLERLHLLLERLVHLLTALEYSINRILFTLRPVKLSLLLFEL
jgi:hypothetical protein